MEPEEMSLPTCYRSVVEATQRMKVVSQISRYVPTWIHRLMRPIALHLAPTPRCYEHLRTHKHNGSQVLWDDLASSLAHVQTAEARRSYASQSKIQGEG